MPRLFIQTQQRNRRVLSQESQCGRQHPPLLGSVTRLAQRTAPIQAGRCGPRRRSAADEAAPAGQGGGDAVHFQSAGSQSNGLDTQRSGRDQQHPIRLVVLGGLQNGGDGLAENAADVGLVAAVTDDERGQCADFAFGGHVL